MRLLLLALALTACTAKSPESLVAAGKSLSANNDPGAAVIQFKAALQLDPKAKDARLLLGQALLESGDAFGAVVELTKVRDEKIVPLDAVLPTLTQALLYSGDNKKLVTFYGAIELQDKSAQAALKTNVASAWAELGDRTKSEAALAASLAADPNFGPAKILKARLLAGQGKFDDAALLVDEVLSRNDKFHEAWQLRGELLNFAKNDPKGAEDAFRKALAISKGHVQSHASIIGLKVRLRDIAGAKLQAAQLRAVAPNHPYTALVDAQLAFLDGETVRARELVQRLMRTYNDHVGILLLAGAVESKLGSAVQATAYLGKVIQLNPELHGVRVSLAQVEIKLGQYAKALETLKPALNTSPPTVEAVALAGEAHLRLGNTTLAEDYFTRAAKLDPTNLRLQTAAVVSRMWTGDTGLALSELELLRQRSQDTFVEDALFAARMRRREFDAALATLDAMEKKQPGQATHYEMRGRVHLARRDLPAARRALEQAVKADPALFAAVSSLTYIDLLENKPAQAINRLQASVTADPKNWFAILALAELKARNGGTLAEVKKLLADAIAAAPSEAEPRLRLIELTLRRRQFKDALAAAQEASSALPGDVRILEAVGKAQMQAGSVEQAASTFKRLASAQPDSPQPYMRLAEIYTTSGQGQQALAAINRALEISPGLVAAQVALIDALSAANQQRNALEYIRRFKQSKPKLATGYALEAVYHSRRRDNEAAVAALREGTAKTNSPELAGKLYSLLLQVGRTAEAEEFGAGWMKQHPQDAAFEFLQSVSDIARGDFASAEARLKRVIKVYPNNAIALNNLAFVLVKIGGKGAVMHAQRAVDLVPDQPELMDTLALALAADNEIGLAMDMQKRALELAPTNDGLRLGLARLAIQAGDKALAREELQRLQKLGSAFPGQADVTKLMQGL